MPCIVDSEEGSMEKIITGFVDLVIVPITNVVVFVVTNGVAFALFALLWLGFGYALIASQGSLDAAWQWVRSLPLLIQGLAWLVFLPVLVALWIWQTTWPIVLRLIVIAGLAWWSLMMFVPKWLQAARP
jgi:hypothetical protein